MKLVLSLAALAALASAKPVSNSILARSSSLQPRQSSVCASDASCQMALSGIQTCYPNNDIAGYLSCYCGNYGPSLGQCMLDDCTVGLEEFSDYNTFDQVTVNSCVLYDNGDLNDAYACYNSGDYNSASCLAALDYVSSSTAYPETSTTFAPAPSSTAAAITSTASFSITAPTAMSTSANAQPAVQTASVISGQQTSTSGAFKMSHSGSLLTMAAASLLAAVFVL